MAEGLPVVTRTPAEIETREVKRRKLLALLSSDEPYWKSEDHPELKDGAAAWVSQIPGSPQPADGKSTFPEMTAAVH